MADANVLGQLLTETLANLSNLKSPRSTDEHRINGNVSATHRVVATMCAGSAGVPNQIHVGDIKVQTLEVAGVLSPKCKPGRGSMCLSRLSVSVSTTLGERQDPRIIRPLFTSFFTRYTVRHSQVRDAFPGLTCQPPLDLIALRLMPVHVSCTRLSELCVRPFRQ